VDLTSLDARGLDALAFSRAVLDGGATMLQLRAKREPAHRVLGLLRALRPICEERSVLLVANDRADLALMAGCSGLHVGQDDPPPAAVRELCAASGRTLLVGLSTHDEAQAERAAGEPVDYIAVGPVRGTATKENPDPVLGIGRARNIAERIKARRAVPVVAIGGIDPGAASELAGAFDAVAVVGALLPAPGEPIEVARDKARAFVHAFSAPGSADAAEAGR
jgi:thiamine-phosphate pyrophosphorylase